MYFYVRIGEVTLMRDNLMEMFDGCTRYDNIKRNAYWNNVHLDSRFHPTADEVETAIEHLKDCHNNPTVSLIARRKYRTNNYPDCFQRNLKEVYDASAWVRRADSAYRNRFAELYPKTAKARKLLIKTQSIVLNCVKPIEKGLKRSFIKLISKI